MHACMRRYMADLLIGYLQNVGLHVLAHSGGKLGQLPHELAVREPLPQPMFDGNWETHASHCRVGDEFRELVSNDTVRA